jgi:heptaprenyl diphosphate synthase
MNKQLTKQIPQASEKNMLSLATALPELKEVEEKLLEIVSANSTITAEIGNHLISSGGKRLRPLLTILSGSQFKANRNQLVTAGTAVELIHLASLVHDDIIDKAGTRRGVSSVNAKWGDKTAVLMGDYLFAKAFGLLAKEKLYAILQMVVDCIQEMCDGEIEQDKDKFNLKQTGGNYYRRIYQKTAKLIGVCCRAGAITANATREEQLALEQYGLHLGFAFQITDDILDFTGQEEALGKPVASDLAQGNLTLPVLLLRKDTKWGPWLTKKLEEKKFLPDDLLEVREALKNSGAINTSIARAYLHINKAKKQLLKLPSSPYRGAMESIANMIVRRNY